MHNTWMHYDTKCNLLFIVIVPIVFINIFILSFQVWIQCMLEWLARRGQQLEQTFPIELNLRRSRWIEYKQWQITTHQQHLGGTTIPSMHQILWWKSLDTKTDNWISVLLNLTAVNFSLGCMHGKIIVMYLVFGLETLKPWIKRASPPLSIS